MGAHQKSDELATQFLLTENEKRQVLIASLLHDCAKLMSPQELIAYAEKYQLGLELMDRQTPQTLHPFVGAHRVEAEFGIEDDEILNAIRYHTTARPAMTLVEKIVFVADKIEENTRDPHRVKQVTQLLDGKDRRTLDQAVLFLLDETIQFLIEKQQLVHLRTIEARNDLVLCLKASKREIVQIQ
jgi:predicted HD superfamily hydrolase involved in NAD metabolism